MQKLGRVVPGKLTSFLWSVLVLPLVLTAGEVPSEVDVLVAGGTTAAVEAAVAAKASGKSVLLVSPRPYLGEDTAGRLELAPIPAADEPMAAKAVFRPTPDGAKTRTTVMFDEPTEVTRIEMVTLERGWGKDTCRTKECHFIYSEDGKTYSEVIPLKVVMNYGPQGSFLWRADQNRKVKLVAVGATRGAQAKRIGVEDLKIFRRCAPGTKRAPTPLEAKTALDERLIAAGVPYLTGGMGVDVLFDADRRVSGAVFATRGGLRTVRAKCTVDASVHGTLLKLAGGALAPLPETVRLSRVVLSGERPAAPGLEVEELPRTLAARIQKRGKAFEPVTARFYRCSFDWRTDDTPRGWAAADMRARDLTWTLRQIDAADELTVPVRTCAKDVPGLVYLPVGGTLSRFETPEPKMPVVLPKRKSPILATCDVCVVGAGTAGAPATIAAARAGAKTVAVDYMYGFGGLGTLGMIGYYWYGTICGFTDEVEKGIAALGAAVPGVGKREWWRREAVKAGAEAFFGSMAYDVMKEGDKVVGVVVATPYGTGVIRAKTVVDATGAADLAAAAGERTAYIGADELALQSAGLPPRVPGYTYVNSDFGYANDNDVTDTTLFLRRGRLGAKGEWDVAQIVGTRERRRLVGAFAVQAEDVLNERTFPDTIATGSTDFDTHGPTVADVCFLSPATDKHVFRLNVPYRALLPAKTDGLLVCGIGASAHRDAQPFLRMQADVQNIGYAAGRAAAMSAATGKPPRAIDVKALQRHLADIGSIPAAALEWKDNFPLSDADWKAAVAAVGDGFRGAPLVLTDRTRARRDLKAAFAAETDPKRRLCFAQTLGMLGEADGAAVLAENLSRPAKEFVQVVPEDAKRFGKRMSNRDAQLVALARTRSSLAVPVVRAEVERLTPSNAGLTHVRALALACDALRDAALAPGLAAALREKGLGGRARASADELPPLGGFTRTDGPFERTVCQRELSLARALYRCGDKDGLGRRTLEAYAVDPRGTYAAHARAVLAEKCPAARPQAPDRFDWNGFRVAPLCGGTVSRVGGTVAVTVKPNEPWSGVTMVSPTPVDLTRHGYVAVAVTNRSAVPAQIILHAKNRTNPDRSLQGSVNLAPFAAGEVKVSTLSLRSFPTDLILPGMRDYESGRKGSAIDPSRLEVFCVFGARTSREVEFSVLSFRVEGAGSAPKRVEARPDFFPFVDRFGQYAHADWPGKVHDEKELAEGRAAEERFLAAHAESPIPGADRFGGWGAGPQLKATGFFRVEKVDGKWWFVDPDGHLFYSQGIDCVRYGSATGTTKRERFFSWLPAKDDRRFDCCRGLVKWIAPHGFYSSPSNVPYASFDFACANLVRLDGERWLEAARDRAHRRLKAWGLNTIGNWSDEATCRMGRTPYVATVGTAYNFPKKLPRSKGWWGPLPDVYDPGFPDHVRRGLHRVAAWAKDDPWCLGVFVDNELSWNEEPETLKAAQRYYEVVTRAFREEFPNHLYLGCRFMSNPGEGMMRLAAEHCDVVSLNVYNHRPAIPYPASVRDRPAIVGEFHFGALDRGMFHTGLVPTANQAERAVAYGKYVRDCLADDRIVGAHWFQYRDQAFTGRNDGECFQIGFLNAADAPYPEMVEMSRTLARELYAR